MKIGAMNNPAQPVYDEVGLLVDANFDFVDLTIEGPNALHVDPEKLQALLDRNGATVTGHTDPCLPYAYPIQSVRDACLKELERCAVIFSKLGATIMNIHPCYVAPPAMKQALVISTIEALKPIVEMASSYGLTVVLENFIAPFDKVSNFELILSEVPGLKVHLDFGHANIGRDNYETFCGRLGSHIRHVHFSDNRSRTDDHMPLGVGHIDWKNAVDILKATGYDDTITLEVFCEDPGMRFKYLDLSRQMVLELWD
jgi:sugar phosphate isomerase/epimerase